MVVSYNSGPMAEDWDPQERNVTPERDDEQSVVQWHRVMARSGSHWVELNAGHFPDPPRGKVGD